MRLFAPFIIAVLLLALPAAQPSAAPVPTGLSCKSFLVYDIAAEQAVGYSNHEYRAPIASLSKLMTAILVCERMRFDGRYVLSQSERDIFGVDMMRADKMLEMMLVASNNRICKVAARIISGDEDSFAVEMNARAAQLGMYDTRFANASGLPGGEQYSTIGDLLVLARVAQTYPRIREAMAERRVELDSKFYPSTLKDLYDRHPGLVGGKTGYTRAAGRCLVLRYNCRGREYYLITMGSSSVRSGFRDAELILSFYGLYDGEVGEWRD
jgi:D-alanyl-D-alanine carboxypeptidase (penicillin-binding protein 5/6)